MKAYKGGKTGNSAKQTKPNLKVINEARGKIAVNNLEMKYPQMLLELIKPFHSDASSIEEIEALLELASLAWNISNMKKLIPVAYQTMWQGTKTELGNDPESVHIVETMIKEKKKKFDQYELFIMDAQLKSDEGGVFVSVVAKPLDAFLEEALADNEEDDDELNFTPGYINRSAFTVLPQQPFYDWLEKTEGNSLFPREISDPGIYLLAERNTNEEIELWLQDNYDRIFQIELGNWFEDKKLWPKNRTYQMFKDWFTISYQSMIYDLEDFPVDKE